MLRGSRRVRTGRAGFLKQKQREALIVETDADTCSSASKSDKGRSAIDPFRAGSLGKLRQASAELARLEEMCALEIEEHGDCFAGAR